MSRGRRAIPDEIKALKGNPGKRKLALKRAVGVDTDDVDATYPVANVTLVIPELLTDDREKEIFRKVVDDHLQRRVARVPDLTAYARWASYLHRWVSCKEQLDGKPTWFTSTGKHGDMLRRHPVFKDMLDLERMLMSLEDRLGLNPLARQNIVRGLSAMPAALSRIFGEDDPIETEMPEAPGPEGPALSPLGFLQTSGKPH